jgi:hypothetical protein
MTNQLSHQNFFPDLSKLTLRRVFKTDQAWIMEAEGQDSAVCPGCQSISRSRHSRYWRSLQDLPIQGTPVLIRLHGGRRHCRNAGCKRPIFTECPLNVCAPYARQTKRSDEIIAVVGRAVGGRPGQRLMGRLGMPLSAETLVRHVKGAARLSYYPSQNSVIHKRCTKIASEPLNRRLGGREGPFLVYDLAAIDIRLHPHHATRTQPIARERAEFHARELLPLHGADSFAVKTTVRQIVRYHSWLVTLPGSLLGAIGGESELLLNILAP